MTMSFYVEISGERVGQQIGSEPEEFWQLLQAMLSVSSDAAVNPEHFAQDVADHAGSEQPISDKVVELLYLVAAKIEAVHHG